MTSSPPQEPSASPRRAALAALLAVTPALMAIVLFEGFVTQDGPAHLYNAHVLARSFDPASPFQHVFEVRWEPLPNWAGHLALMGLVSAFTPRLADRLMTATTLALFAVALGWLRGRVAGGRGAVAAGIFAGMLALNITWLFGFTSFLLGAALFPATLSVWWSGRDAGFSWRRAAALAALGVLGYFCHLVSLGLTALGLIVLEALTPGGHRRGRAKTTALGLIPLLPLAFLYLRLMKQGGGIQPQWHHLANPLSPRSWFTQLGWVDPITLARKDVIPLLDGVTSSWCGVFAPVVWLGLGLVLILLATRIERERLGWWILGIVLTCVGIVAPDTLGASHGGYLPQRIVLLGLAALVPVVQAGKLATAALSVALILQTATVFEYAQASDRTAGRLLRAAPEIGRNRAASPPCCVISVRAAAPIRCYTPIAHSAWARVILFTVIMKPSIIIFRSTSCPSFPTLILPRSSVSPSSTPRLRVPPAPVSGPSFSTPTAM